MLLELGGAMPHSRRRLRARPSVICDYNALLLSVTGLLRMDNYCVFQAHDGLAAEELCGRMPKIALLVLNTYGTGIEVGGLVRRVRLASPEIQILHLGSTIPDGLLDDVPPYPRCSPRHFSSTL